MVSLPDLLREAGTRRADEIVLQAGARATIQTNGASAEVGDVWSESELFDALAKVLGPEQQAELAVGQVVEFSVQQNGIGWSMITEPTRDGVTVRGRARGHAAPVSDADDDSGGASLDLPALEPFRPDGEAAPPPRRPRSTRFDIGVDYGPPGDGPQLERAPAPETTTTTGPPRGRGTLAMPTPRPPSTGSADVVARLEPADAVAPTMEIAATIGDLFSKLSLADTPADTGGVAELLAKLPEGALCFFRDTSGSEDVAASVPGTPEIIDDSTLDAVGALALDELPDDVWWVVRLEDPSRCLGFVLRRLEEGGRVLVETRARTPSGAARILLGLGATTLTAAWLAAQDQRMLVREASGWALHDLGGG